MGGEMLGVSRHQPHLSDPIRKRRTLVTESFALVAMGSSSISTSSTDVAAAVRAVISGCNSVASSTSLPAAVEGQQSVRVPVFVSLP
jgi:hypothetical protein